MFIFFNTVISWGHFPPKICYSLCCILRWRGFWAFLGVVVGQLWSSRCVIGMQEVVTAREMHWAHISLIASINSFVTSQWNVQMFWLTIEPKVCCDRRPPNRNILQYHSVTDSLVVCPLPPLLLLYDEWSRHNIWNCWIYIYSFSLKAYESVRAMETSSEWQNELSEAKSFGGADQSSGSSWKEGKHWPSSTTAEDSKMTNVCD